MATKRAGVHKKEKQIRNKAARRKAKTELEKVYKKQQGDR